MKVAIRWGVAICGAILLMTFIWTRAKQPEYKGQSLHRWLAQPTNEHYETAIQAMGTEALDTLERMLRVRDNNWKRSLRFGVEKIPWVNWQLATPAEKHRAALRACKVLGTNAVSLAPLILEHFNHWEAVEALVNMRAAAVPTLVGSLASTSDGVRFAATAALAMIGPDAVDAVPDLANLLSKDTSNVRILAAAALGLIGRNPAVAVPALREALAVPAIDVQRTAAMALATFGAAAKSAIPDLIKAKQSQDIVVRSNAMHALKAIDPQSFGDYE